MTQKNFKYPFKLNDLPYVEDFTGTNGNSLRPELWELSSFTINNNMAYMSSGTASTITSSKFSLSGDFSIQVDVTTTAQPASEYWMMQLITKIDDSNNVYTSLGYFNGNFVYISRKKINNVFTDVFVSVQSAGAVASGTLKVSRINNVFYFGVNEVSLSSYDYSSAPDIQSVLLSHSNDTVSNIGSSWDNFTINSADDISWTYNFMDTFDGVDTDDPAENLWKNIIGESNTTRGLLSNKLRHTCSTGTNAAIVDVSKFKLSGDFDVQIDMDDISKITPSSSKTYGYDLVLSKEDQYLSDNFITDNYVYGRVGFNDTSLSNITTTKCIWDDEILNGEGDVHAWGRNNYGQCNHTNTTTPIYDETTVRISGVKEIACGFYHTVVLKENGDVHSWGHNVSGQCNHTNTTSPVYDETTVRISGIKEIACGGYHTVVLKEYEHPFIGTSQKMRVTRTISGSDSIINVFVTDIGTSVETHMIDGMIISNYVGDFDVILKQDNDDLNTDALSCDFNNFVINSCDKIIWPGGILKRWDGVNWISSVINKFTSQTGTTFTETFTGPNGDAPNIYYWIDRSYGGGSMQLNNNELELYAPASSSSGGGCNSIFHLSGDFIIDAEYDVTGATGNDYWWMGLSVSNPEYTAQWAAIKIEETSLINKAVSHRWDDDGANDGSTRVSRTSDIGKIRIQRIGTSISSFIDEGSGWVQVGSSETWINDNCYVVLQSYNSTAASIPTDFTSWFDNFEIVSADSIDWNDAGNWEDSILKRHDGSNWEYVGNIE